MQDETSWARQDFLNTKKKILIQVNFFIVESLQFYTFRRKTRCKNKLESDFSGIMIPNHIDNKTSPTSLVQGCVRQKSRLVIVRRGLFYWSNPLNFIDFAPFFFPVHTNWPKCLNAAFYLPEFLDSWTYDDNYLCVIPKFLRVFSVSRNSPFICHQLHDGVSADSRKNNFEYFSSQPGKLS